MMVEIYVLDRDNSKCKVFVEGLDQGYQEIER